VADNCTDDTAVVAAIAGAEVIERHERERVGKGFALDYGLRHLDIESPDIVVVIDADCRLGASAIDALASMCAMSRRPTQALYLMTQASEARISDLVAEFAWRVKNWVRPLGLGALGLPCQLAGTGMAFPWNVIQTADLATGSIVEDLKLGLDLAAAGHAPLFCPSARVTSEFAASAKGAEIQRTRWEEGHLTMILQGLPRLIYTALVRRNMALLVLALDLAVPPLSLLMLLLIGLFTIAVAVAGIGLSCTPPVISGANLLALAVAVFLSWLKYGRDVLPWRAICLIPGYVVRKLPHYGRILLGRRTTRWIRTERK
jgi:cellulose synthase/poly-beta-1,6-N-acetylglucosamine synthase-like glycosyltransferase